MVLSASAPVARSWRHVRFLLLALACLLVAHHAVYMAHHGLGDGLSEAMVHGGHGDGAWPPFGVLCVASAAALGVVAIARLFWLLRLGRSVPLARSSADPGLASYAGELVRLWLALLPTSVVGFAILENLELGLDHGEVLGVGALIGPEHPMALPILALVSFLASAFGALVRWRIAVFEARLALARRPRLPRHSCDAARPLHGWIAALDAHSWILVRPDAGRAPPSAA